MSPVFSYSHPGEVADAAEWIMAQLSPGDVLLTPIQRVDHNLGGLRPDGQKFVVTVQRNRAKA